MPLRFALAWIFAAGVAEARPLAENPAQAAANAQPSKPPAEQHATTSHPAAVTIPEFALAQGRSAGTYRIPDTRAIAIELLRTPGFSTVTPPFQVYLPLFRDRTNGTLLEVALRSSTNFTVTGPSNRVYSIVANGDVPLLRLELGIGESQGPNTYEGFLGIREGSAAWTAYPMTLVNPAPRLAGLWISRSNVTVSVSSSNPGFRLQIGAKTNGPAAEAIAVVVERVAKARDDSFADGNSIAWTLNGKAVPGFYRGGTNANGAWDGPSLGPGTVADLNGTVQGLAPGEYDVTLRFVAANGSADDSPRLQLKIEVRHPWWWAALVLGASVFASWLLTTGLGIARQRLMILEAITWHEGDLAGIEGQFPGVVRTKALLAQVKAVCGWWIYLRVGPDFVGQRLKDATESCGVLKKFGIVLRAVDRSSLQPFIKVRIRAKLRALASDLEGMALGDPSREGLVSGIGTYSLWLSPDKKATLYADDLGRDLFRVVNDYRLDSDPSRLGPLPPELKELRVAAQPQSNSGVDELIACEENYARLKLICERWKSVERQALLNAKGSIEDVFLIADNAAWERLIAASKTGGFQTTLRCDRLEAFELFALDFSSGNPELDSTFLVQHGLEYRWDWQVGEGSSAKKWTETSDRPILAQFSPCAGRLAAKVTLLWKGESVGTTISESIAIAESSQIGLLARIGTLQLGWLIGSAAFAVLTGLSTQYFGKPLFGTGQDYLTLFLYGFGIDLLRSALRPMSIDLSPMGPSALSRRDP